MFIGSIVSLALAAEVLAGGPELPAGFVTEAIGSDWVLPTGLAFLGEKRLVVAEKAGVVWFVENDQKKNVVIDLRAETLNNGDRGIMGIAVDPAYAANGWLYLLLVVDANEDGIDDELSAFSRLVRYTTWTDASGNLLTEPSSRVELLGATWPTGIPSCHLTHAAGTIRFLSDGSLVLSHGDSADPNGTDGGSHDADCFTEGRFSPDQDIGAFRSLYEKCLGGKILRLDPATGLGLPDNPFFDGDPSSIQSRVYATGLRNPFRFTLQPGSGPREALFISDVGWNTWEEVNLALGGENFGWPCYEGPHPQSLYQSNDPLGFCPGAAASEVPPLITWHHYDPSHAGFVGNCATGIAFYEGGSYPPIYAQALFFMDYGNGWLKVAYLDEALDVVSIVPFGTSMNFPIDLVTEPVTGDLVYLTKSVHRIRYTGLNHPPTVVATATPAWGDAPLQVQLTGSQSSDLDQDPISFFWDLGDGTSSNSADVQHLYPDPTIDYRPRLVVTDSWGFQAWEELLITPGNTPPTIDWFKLPHAGELYDFGKETRLFANVTDVEDEAKGEKAAAVWHVDLIHDHHEHPDHFVVGGEQATFVPDVLYDGTSFEVRLVVEDSRGLRIEQSVPIYDANTRPKAHIVGSDDFTPRLHRSIQMTGHMELPGNLAHGFVPTLTWDWGDGTQDVVEHVGHQEDCVSSHLYQKAGTYPVMLTARTGPYSSSVEVDVRVLALRSAVAVFVPSIVQRYLDSAEQHEIADAIADATLHAGHESAVFVYNEQPALLEWMTEFMDDGVNDVVVMLDVAPAVAYAGEDADSLAERWMKSGNTVVWTGATPFSEYVFADGDTSTDGAGLIGADDLLDAILPRIVSGAGPQELEALAVQIPSLAAFHATRALRYDLLGPEWRADLVYARDGDSDSDAIVVRHDSGGAYAQFLCKDEAALPRREVLVEFLRTRYLRPWRRSD